MTYTEKYHKKIPINKTKRIYVINNKNRYLVNTQRNIKKKQPHKNKKKWTLKKTLNSVKEIWEKVDDPLQQKKMFGGAGITGNLQIEDNLLTYITNQLDLIEAFLVSNQTPNNSLVNLSGDEIIEKMKMDFNTIKDLIPQNSKLNNIQDIERFFNKNINIGNIKYLKNYYTKLKGYIIINNQNDTTFTLKSSTINNRGEMVEGNEYVKVVENNETNPTVNKDIIIKKENNATTQIVDAVLNLNEVISPKSTVGEENKVNEPNVVINNIENTQVDKSVVSKNGIDTSNQTGIAVLNLNEVIPSKPIIGKGNIQVDSFSNVTDAQSNPVNAFLKLNQVNASKQGVKESNNITSSNLVNALKQPVNAVLELKEVVK